MTWKYRGNVKRSITMNDISTINTWQCIVQPAQTWRREKDKLLFSVEKVKRIAYDVDVYLITLNRNLDEDCWVKASSLCGGDAWSRLCDLDDAFSDEDEEPITPTQVGIGPRR